jgi:hypothetical protein
LPEAQLDFASLLEDRDPIFLIFFFFPISVDEIEIVKRRQTEYYFAAGSGVGCVQAS